MYHSLLYQLRGTRSTDTLVAMNTSVTQILFSSILFNKQNQISTLNNWLILGFGKEIYKMGLEHLEVSGSKGLVKKKEKKRKENQKITVMGYIKGTQESTQRASNDRRWKKLSNKNIDLDCDPKLNRYL